MTLTHAQAANLRSELARLKAARPTTVAEFALQRAARKASIETILASAVIEADPSTQVEDPRVLAVLAAASGGDQFGR